MIAYDKHQCTNHFLSIAKINCNNNCISQIIPMYHYVKNYIILHGSNSSTLRRQYILLQLLMINLNAQIIFFPVQKPMAITIVFHISFQCAILSEIPINIPSHGSNCNRFIRHFIPWLLMIYIHTQVALQKLITITIVFL